MSRAARLLKDMGGQTNEADSISKKLIQALNTAWEDIAHDFLSAISDDGDPETALADRDEVITAVLDSPYAAQEAAAYGVADEFAALKQMDYRDRRKCMLKSFPQKKYGY